MLHCLRHTQSLHANSWILGRRQSSYCVHVLHLLSTVFREPDGAGKPLELIDTHREQYFVRIELRGVGCEVLACIMSEQ